MEMKYWLSFSYWFSSRTLGLLSHPYITMRQIAREHFLRPLAILPVVIWIMSWLTAVFIGRIGLLFELDKVSWSHYFGRVNDWAYNKTQQFRPGFPLF